MSKFFINKELLISLVKTKSELWDRNNGMYKDKGTRKMAWQEIIGMLSKDLDGMTPKEKLDYEKYVIKTWSQLRDCWVRSLHDRKKGKISRRYLYHKHLLFLKTVIKRDLIDAEDSQTIKINDPVKQRIQQNEIDLASDVEPSKRRGMNESTIETTNTQVNYENDRHFAFFKSVQPSLLLLNDDQVLQFQSGVIDLIRSIKSGSNYEQLCQPTSSGHWQPHGYYNPPPRDSPSMESDGSEDFPESKYNISENSK